MYDEEYEDDQDESSDAVVLHPAQADVFNPLMVEQTCRYAVACCSRGFGKSYLATSIAMTAVEELLNLSRKVPNKKIYIIAPTHDQVKEIYMPILLYDYNVEEFAVQVLKDTGKIIFEDGVELIMLSYESVERIRGKGTYLVIWDEVSSCTKGITPKSAWEGTIQPAIISRWSKENADRYGAVSAGRALFISTPKGFNYFYELFNMQEEDSEWKSWRFTYRDSPYLSVAEIEKLRHKLDPVEFASEYEASFKESGNSVFYCFDRTVHVRPDLDDFLLVDENDISRNEVVYCAIDFNVGLQCTGIFAVRNRAMHFLYEIKGHPDTESLAKDLKNRFSKHKIIAFPDPSGKARKTSAPVGRTDFSILEENGIKVLARNAHPPIVDSVRAVNRQLMTAAGDVNLYVHSRCKGIIDSLEKTKWVDRNPDTATIDKSEGVEHFSDGIRYATEYLFPVNSGTKRSVRGFGF